MTFKGTSELDDGTTAVVRSVVEVAALAILAVQRQQGIGRAHGPSLAGRRLI